jgi:calcium-dependent protein kinase
VITYILLCGYPPFYGDSDTQIFESVKVGKFDFPSPEWDDISKAAKDFVISMLKKNPKDRPEASAALKHPWLKEQLGDELVRKTNIAHSGLKFGEFSKYLAMKKLKKAALGHIAGHLTQSELGALEETFRSLDHNGDGTITVDDLKAAIEQGDFTTELKESLSELRRELSLTGEAKLNYKDFVAATIDRNLAMREDNIRVAFDHFRHTEADYLTLEDLSDVFGREAPAKELMNFLDYDGDGKISFEDFRHAVAETFDEDDDAEKDDVEMKTEGEDVDMTCLD